MWAESSEFSPGSYLQSFHLLFPLKLQWAPWSVWAESGVWLCKWELVEVYYMPALNPPRNDYMFMKGGGLTQPAVLSNPCYSREVIRVWSVLFALPLCVTSMCNLCMHHIEWTNANCSDLFEVQQDDEGEGCILPRKSDAKAYVVLVLCITILYPSHWLLCSSVFLCHFTSNML